MVVYLGIALVFILLFPRIWWWLFRYTSFFLFWIYIFVSLRGCVSFDISGRSEEFLARLLGGEAVDTLSRIGNISDLAWVSHIDLKVKSGTCSTKRSEKTDIGNREDAARREQSSQYLPSA